MEKNRRMCLVCKAMKDKCELIRIVKYEGEIKLDPSFKAAGRGAYICRSKDCIDLAVKRKMLNRAFKCEVSQSVYGELSEKANER